MSYLRIEWSGYFDFPEGTYTSGTKAGQPYSGEFSQDIIRLKDSGQVKYSIEEGEPTFPTYEEFTFSLENLDPETGEQNFDYERLSTLGRTKEYGGSRDAIGDLFVRVSIPKMDDKVIFTGMMEDYSYSIRDFHVEINCYSIVRFIKNSKFSMLGKFDLGSGTIANIREDSVIKEYKDVLKDGFSGKSGSESSYALDQATNGLARESVDVFNNYLQFSYVAISDLASAKRTVEQISVGKNIEDYFKEVQFSRKIYDLSDFAGVFENKFFDRVGANNISDEELTLSKFRRGNPRQFTYSKNLGWYNVFLQIGKSTILTRVQPFVNITFGVDSDRNIKEVVVAHCGINFVHMNNGFNSSVIDGKEVLVYERGRFQKENGDQYEKRDSVSIKILDFDRGLKYDNTTISNGKFYNSEPGKLIDVSSKDVFYIGGVRLAFGLIKTKYIDGQKVLFESNDVYFLQNGDKKIKDREGDYYQVFIVSEYNENKLSVKDEDSFNVFNHISKNFSKKFYSRFCLNPTKENLFEEKNLFRDTYQHSFISDVGVYGWVDKKISEVIVSLGRKINAYIYVNEKSKITFHSRNYYERYIPDTRNIPGLVYMQKDQFEIQQGRKYGYGSESYKINWSDIVEINNIKSDLDIEEIVTREGETDDLFVTPKDLEVSNYRTSDLGVPSKREMGNYSEENFLPQRILRRSPFSYLPEEYFSMMPVQMAVNFARSYNYPSMIVSVNVDPFSFYDPVLSTVEDSDNVSLVDQNGSPIGDQYSFIPQSKNINIGSYVAIPIEGYFYELYMVKEIIYSGASVFEKSTSLAISLIYIKNFIGLSKYLRDESNMLILDENNQKIESEQYA